jgi:hypothetical protein
MQKKIVVPIALVVSLVVVGGAVWFTQRDSTSDSQQTSSQTTASQSQSSTGATEFSPVATTDVSYEAKLTSSKDGKTFTATMKSDGKGNSEFEAEQSGQEFKVILTKDAYYSCTGDTCYRLNNRDGAAFNPDSYQYSTEDINSLRDKATYKGTAACGSATCDVWLVKDGASEGTVYIDQSTKRIMKADGVFDGNTGSLTFEYKPVTITVPANAQTVPQ